MKKSPAIANIFKVDFSSAFLKISPLFLSIVPTNWGKFWTLPWLSDIATILTWAALKPTWGKLKLVNFIYTPPINFLCPYKTCEEKKLP